jgi:hypothetical protein
MDSLTITLEPEELQGLRALVEVARAADGTAPPIETDAEGEITQTAKALVRDGLVAKLNDLGLSWAPPSDAIAVRAAKVAQSQAASKRSLRALARNERVTRYGGSVLLTAALVALMGATSGGGTGPVSPPTTNYGTGSTCCSSQWWWAPFLSGCCTATV